MQHRVIRRVVEADVAEVVIARLAGVLEHRGLEDGRFHGTADARLRLAGMDQVRLDVFEDAAHCDGLLDWQVRDVKGAPPAMAGTPPCEPAGTVLPGDRYRSRALVIQRGRAENTRAVHDRG